MALLTTALFDSLPYYDDDLEQNPALKEKVARELAREPQAPQTLHPRVPPAVEPCKNNALLAAELARVEARASLAPLDTVRYQLPGPTSTPGTDEEWQHALQNAQAQLEHQRIRHTNLALLQKYGPNAWRINNYLLEETARQAEKALDELRQRTTDVNRARKTTQTRIGGQLTSLEKRWTELISSILQVEMANTALDAEVDRLNAREAQLASL